MQVGPLLDRLGVEGDQGGDEVVVGAVDHELADVGAQALEGRLDQRRGDVLAAGGLEEVLLAVGDLEEAALVELADVTGVQPAVGVHGLGGLLGLVVVALHDAGAAQQHLAVLGDPRLGAGQRPADRADRVAGRAVDERRGAGLGEAVALEDGQADRVEPVRDVLVERGGPGDEEADPAAEALAHLVQHQLVGQGELLGEHAGGLLAARPHAGDLAADARPTRGTASP